MHFAIGFFLFLMMLYLWLYPHWFGRVVVFLTLGLGGAFLTAFFISGSLYYYRHGGVGPAFFFGQMVPAFVLAWIVAGLPTWMHNRRLHNKPSVTLNGLRLLGHVLMLPLRGIVSLPGMLTIRHYAPFVFAGSSLGMFLMTTTYGVLMTAYGALAEDQMPGFIAYVFLGLICLSGISALIGLLPDPLHRSRPQKPQPLSKTEIAVREARKKLYCPP